MLQHAEHKAAQTPGASHLEPSTGLIHPSPVPIQICPAQPWGRRAGRGVGKGACGSYTGDYQIFGPFRREQTYAVGGLKRKPAFGGTNIGHGGPAVL